jgi:hypothetical protein
MVFEISVVQVPTVIEQQNGGQTKIITPMVMVAAGNATAAALILGAQLGDKVPTDRADNLQVIVRQVA